jgi:hypothetical protein
LAPYFPAVLAWVPLQAQTVTAVRTGQPPRVDGRLSDEAWASAEPIGDFTQSDPLEGQPPSERTEVRVLFDDDQLYIGIRCFESDPSGILATQMKPDAGLEPDDRVIVVLDTFRDRRNGYTFALNPAGARVDGLIAANGEDVNDSWDAIWRGRAAIDTQGWTAEMAIPFQSLSFDPSRSEWGFNVQRVIKRRLENSRWAGARRNVRVYQVSEAGTLAGLTGVHQGLGLDVVPFFTTRWKDTDGGETHLLGRPGLDAFYRLAPNVAAAFTFHTDFADTEVDQRRINLTRFPLFFPEKRDFFLQDAGIFQFADLDSDLIPFFSRRVGLSDEGEEIPIEVGGKLTGRVGDWSLGFLDAQTRAAHDFEAANLFAGRVTHHLGEQSSLGVIGTAGDPDGNGSNALVGVDANFGRSDFLGNRNLRASVWALSTRSDESGSSGEQDQAFGASVSYPNDVWSWRLDAKEIGEQFDPALGFVPRAGVRQYSAELDYAWYLNRNIRWLRFGVEPQIVTDLEGELESAELSMDLVRVLWDTGDEFELEVIGVKEDLNEPFEIEDGLEIPAGDYDWARWRIAVESALKRPLGAEVAAEFGDFYDGRRSDYEAALNWRPSRFFSGGLGYELSVVELPQGNLDAHVGLVRLDFAFSPDLTWSNFAQFDNESDSLGWNSRVQWVRRPGETFNLVVNEAIERSDGEIETVGREFVLAVRYTLRL